MDQAFDKCKGAIAIIDDIQVYSSDTNHDMHLHEAVERTRQAGLKLNYDECVIKTKSFMNVIKLSGIPSATNGINISHKTNNGSNISHQTNQNIY